jgi:glycosyltransferase involved in cell wall biosynthesis
VDATVLIATYNRAGLLAATLDSLAAIKVPRSLRWDVIVVDNNSSDETAQVVQGRAGSFPVPLRWLFEPRQGKSHALNRGMAASAARIFALTDDDVRVSPEWLEAGVRPLLERTDIAYTGGPVHPLWEIPPPAWIDGDPGLLWGPIALVDYGPDPFIFEARQRIALGVNMAVRRSLFEQVGGFHANLDRQGVSLRGQAQAEFFFRTRAAGACGLYVPGMTLQHQVPAARLTRTFYRRWWYAKGVTRAQMQQDHPVSELGLDLSAVPHIARVPRFMWRTALGEAAGWVRAAGARRSVDRAEHEMKLAYFTGYVAGRFSPSEHP